MFIENVSLAAIQKGWHCDPGENSMLIQIVDPDNNHPTPKYNFKHVLKLKFLDLESEGHPLAPKAHHAAKIVDSLVHARDNRMNVIVHCHAGVCRSGAVAQFAIDRLGFQDTGSHRIPNTLLKKYLNYHFDFDTCCGRPDLENIPRFQ